jgi:hypothetical protein
MNENSSTQSSTSAPHHGLTAEAISRRAYELWEKEGRPENRDLHHWLRAEKELLAEQEDRSKSQGTSNQVSTDRVNATDTQPLQGTRAAAAASRDTKTATKRTSTSTPFSGEKSAPPRSTQPGMRTDSIRSGGRA